eukprot:scaffold8655_cov42-Phaeocystis_antarctica.AAC.2
MLLQYERTDTGSARGRHGRIRHSGKGELFLLPRFCCPPTLFVGGQAAAGTTPTTARRLARGATAVQSRSRPVVMAPQREDHVGRPSTPRQSCAAPRVRPTRCCSAS